MRKILRKFVREKIGVGIKFTTESRKTNEKRI